MTGALHGVRVVEIGSLGAAPFAAMVLADHGADVLRVERPDKAPLPGAEVRDDLVAWDILSRGRRSAGIDLRHPDGAALVASLCDRADVLIEGLRPGVMERLGVGPEVLCDRNPRLVYGRLTGWGRTGDRAERVGHDINYIGLSGVLTHIGRAGDPPAVPLNIAGDFGGGGLLLAFGICAALVERLVSGKGQVVDAAMVDGAALLMAPLFGAHGSGFWSDERGTNLLDSGAPFYDCYECADGGYVAVGAIEERFFAELLRGLDLGEDPSVPAQHDQGAWPDLRRRLAERFLTRPRDAWAAVFIDLDACVSPVLTMGEAPHDPHLRAWGTFIAPGGTEQPAPAPRFSRSDPGVPSPPQVAGANTDAVLAEWGVADDEVRRLRDVGAIR